MMIDYELEFRSFQALLATKTSGRTSLLGFYILGLGVVFSPLVVLIFNAGRSLQQHPGR